MSWVLYTSYAAFVEERTVKDGLGHLLVARAAGHLSAAAAVGSLRRAYDDVGNRLAAIERDVSTLKQDMAVVKPDVLRILASVAPGETANANELAAPLASECWRYVGMSSSQRRPPRGS